MKGVPGDAARRRGLKRILVPLLLLGIAFGAGLGLVAGALCPLPHWTGLAVLAAATLGMALYGRRQQAFVYGFFKGARGEEMTAGELARLGGDWTVYNGLLLPDGTDIDHVAVGPQGLFVVETKHWSGAVRVENGQILANGRPVTHRPPVAQVRRAVAALAKELSLPETALHGVLCFAGKQFPAPAALDEICVCSHLGLADALAKGGETLAAADRARIVARLDHLAITEGL